MTPRSRGGTPRLPGRHAGGAICEGPRPSRSRGPPEQPGTQEGNRTAKRGRTVKPSNDASVGTVVTKKDPVRRVGYIYPPCGCFVATEVDVLALRATRGSLPRSC